MMMRKVLKKIKSQSQKGFSLMEMLMAISIFSILLLISVESFWRAEQALKNQDQMISRMRLFHSLITIMGMPASLRASVENNGANSDLWKCVRGYICFPTGAPKDLTLYLPPLYSNGSSVITSGAISGPPGNPLLYNLDGQPCNGSAGACDPQEYPIAVSTQYQVICPPRYDQHAKGDVWATNIYPAGLVVQTDDCQMAHYFRIFFKFEPAAGAPSSMTFPTVTGSVMVNSVMVQTGQ